MHFHTEILHLEIFHHLSSKQWIRQSIVTSNCGTSYFCLGFLKTKGKFWYMFDVLLLRRFFSLDLVFTFFWVLTYTQSRHGLFLALNSEISLRGFREHMGCHMNLGLPCYKQTVYYFLLYCLSILYSLSIFLMFPKAVLQLSPLDWFQYFMLISSI